MSTTCHLVCHATKQTLWIGQGRRLESFYSGEPTTMKALALFLQATLGHPLVVMRDFEVDSSAASDYEDFMERLEQEPTP